MENNIETIAKENARQLIEKYNLVVLDTALGGSNIRVKQCALITVDEILSMGIFSSSGDWEMAKPYWEEVKEELLKL